jgi:RNA polymerase sigma-70 factor (ECF subfamily)
VDGLVDRDALPAYHLLYATRADFRRRLGRTAGAVEDYERAVALAPNEADRRLLERALATARQERLCE